MASTSAKRPPKCPRCRKRQLYLTPGQASTEVRSVSCGHCAGHWHTIAEIQAEIDAAPKDVPGRVRIRLAKMLQEKGFCIEATDLMPTEGDYRIRKLQWDVEAWAGYGAHPDGTSAQFHSYDTMTDCIRFGFECGSDRELSGYYEVHANREG